ncbi:MAG TPA: chemotaxis protein CheW [Beijerinckiaceae bacterium]|nr:chemotaxis protein CheW [Beijerinckiaceae bacterium]
MSNAAVNRPRPPAPGDRAQVVTLRLDGQLIGLPIEQVLDVFQVVEPQPVPLTAPSVVGLVNLRGRILPVLSLAGLLGLPKKLPGKTRMAVGVPWRGEIYGVEIDDIGDVIEVSLAASEPLPAHLGETWARAARCVHKLERGLMIELDLVALLEQPLTVAA